MRRSVVLVLGGLLTLAVLIAGCSSSNSPKNVTKAIQANKVSPPVQGQAAPIPGVAHVCDDANIPAYKPDSDRGPLPGGGITSAIIWDKAKAQMEKEDYPAHDLDWKAYNLGISTPGGVDQKGMIYPNGDVCLFGGGPIPLVRGVELVNTQPNGGEPIVPGSHLYLHSAADAIGDAPCRAIIQIQTPSGGQGSQELGDFAGVTCTANGAFRIIPPPKVQE